ncbi:reverse transcriptase family protein [Aureliella helgolandensis]|uniref:RNA-directed DNA polymerase n=1 Tax=Aureliella helgolandensis TaxID=2527968 RepID=A0A518GFJ7_9BACT|nr:reverse transcriptase family protein [Aureliella helgolandensis]QDV27372.1 Reverse transcriptase (RNA-dependent DNA polymerase) [Aureliella helgolandensis]
METWSAHQLFTTAERSIGKSAAYALQSYAQSLEAKKLPVVFTLRHLSTITGVSYRVLHQTVNRKREACNYRMYAIKKRSGGRRIIHSVCEDLIRVQDFVNREILQRCQPHPASFAFHSSGGIKECASMHCGARWVFQFDLSDFFYDVTEIDVYRIFDDLGYRSLLAFELARLCTTTKLPRHLKHLLYHCANPDNLIQDFEDDFEKPGNGVRRLPYPERHGVVGVLPQGAPTSPMLSNLAARRMDELLQSFAFDSGFVYTRYADDLTFSAARLQDKHGVCSVRREVIGLIRKSGFKENSKKSRIAGPGSKKVVLGLLVDGDTPRISRETYRRIDRLLYGALQNGFESASAFNKFDSALGFYNHLGGLIAFVKSVDEKRWSEFSNRMRGIEQKWGDFGDI